MQSLLPCLWKDVDGIKCRCWSCDRRKRGFDAQAANPGIEEQERRTIWETFVDGWFVVGRLSLLAWTPMIVLVNTIVYRYGGVDEFWLWLFIGGTWKSIALWWMISGIPLLKSFNEEMIEVTHLELRNWGESVKMEILEKVEK